MGKLNLSVFQLLCDSSTESIRFIEVSKEMLSGSSEEFEYKGSDTFYKLFAEVTDNYFWLVAEFGNPQPYRKNLIDVETCRTSRNRRRDTEAELTSQSFLFYDFDSKRLYLSNSRHRDLFCRILSQQFDLNLIIKHIFINFDEFISKIKSVNKIGFTGTRNLFNADSRQSNALKNLTGTDSPESFSLEATYKEKGKILGFLNFLNKSRKENKIDNLIICGEDESGLEKIYNADSFTAKISINCKKNEEGVYDHDFVRDGIINKIK